jgi:hypothetical protein
MDANRRYFLEAQTLGGLDPAVAREDSTASINHDGPEKPKIRDAFRELFNLPLAVNTRISGIEFQVSDRDQSDCGRSI